MVIGAMAVDRRFAGGELSRKINGLRVTDTKFRMELVAPKGLIERFRPAPASVPGLLSTLQAYGGLRARATRGYEGAETLGRMGSLEVRLARTAAEVRQ